MNMSQGLGRGGLGRGESGLLLAVHNPVCMHALSAVVRQRKFKLSYWFIFWFSTSFQIFYLGLRRELTVNLNSYVLLAVFAFGKMGCGIHCTW